MRLFRRIEDRHGVDEPGYEPPVDEEPSDPHARARLRTSDQQPASMRPEGRPNVAAVHGTDWIVAIGARRTEDIRVVAKARKSPRFGPPSRVAQIEFKLRRWNGPVGEWSEHFGKGKNQVCSLDGDEPLRSCQEVEVAKRLRAVRDHAFWFSGYNPARMPTIWQPWVSTLGEAPDWLAALDTTIRQRISSQRGGMPDVVAWKDFDPLASAIFIECKGRGESFKDAQEDWVWAAQEAGVDRSQIAVSVLPF